MCKPFSLAVSRGEELLHLLQLTHLQGIQLMRLVFFLSSRTTIQSDGRTSLAFLENHMFLLSESSPSKLTRVLPPFQVKGSFLWRQHPVSVFCLPSLLYSLFWSPCCLPYSPLIALLQIWGKSHHTTTHLQPLWKLAHSLDRIPCQTVIVSAAVSLFRCAPFILTTQAEYYPLLSLQTKRYTFGQDFHY